jgi:tRNA1(Val) A37 N6-methylase TrmN6
LDVSGEERTLDGFLGGRLAIAQPKRGFRAGHDSVLLAAAVPAELGSRVLELGSGAGVAALCLAARVPGVDVLGIEIDSGLVELARDNAARNSMAGRVRFEQGDVLQFDGGAAFDHVFFNPPFYPASGQESVHAARDRAMRDADQALAGWMRTALVAVKDAGSVTAIIRADRASEVLGEAAGLAAILFPLFPHAGEEPKRAIVRVIRGTNGLLRRARGLVLHEADGRNTEAAEAVLRHAAALRLD